MSNIRSIFKMELRIIFGIFVFRSLLFILSLRLFWVGNYGEMHATDARRRTRKENVQDLDANRKLNLFGMSAMRSPSIRVKRERSEAHRPGIYVKFNERDANGGKGECDILYNVHSPQIVCRIASTPASAYQGVRAFIRNPLVDSCLYARTYSHHMDGNVCQCARAG